VSSSFRFAPRALVLPSLLLIPLALVLAHAKRELDDRRGFERSARQVLVTPPATPPPVTQSAIDLALQLYGIEVPASAEHPTLDLTLTDRGLTTRGALMEKALVTIGPAAFTSWSLLGSTLAHELEVHCRQNFLFIHVMDMVGLDGTGEAERQAYQHELRNARRFGLDVVDAELIADTMDYYYPDAVTGEAATHRVRAWLARNFLRGERGY
jgi:hypothetical protein